MRQLNIQKFTTFWKVPKLDNYKFFSLENFFSVRDFRTKDKVPYAYFESDSSYKIPLIPEEKLLSFFNPQFIKVNIVDIEPFPYIRMSRDITMKNPPKDKIQEEVIEKVLSGFTKYRNPRVVISLATGRGKTYVATNIISKLNVRTIIFVKSTKLREQWFESFKKHTDCDNILVTSGSKDLMNLMDYEDGLPDIIITTHSTVNSFVSQTSMKELAVLFIKIGIGLKIYDEFDLENSSMFKIDCNTAIKFNLYLSATDFKSFKQEDIIFTKIYEDSYNIGKEYKEVIERKAKFIFFNSHPSKKEIGKCHVYTADGPQFSYQKFHEYTINKKGYYDELTDLWNNYIKHIYESKDKLKTAFLIGRINTATDFKKQLMEITGVKSSEIGIFNSETPKDKRDLALSKKLIISTSNSLGRGVDLSGLDTLVDFETRHSFSVTKQVIGRVSRSGMKNVGTYIQFIDKGFHIPLRNYNHKKKHNVFDEEFTKIEEIDLKKDKKDK